MGYRVIILAFATLVFCACSRNYKNNKGFDESYQIGPIPNIEIFSSYTDVEKRMAKNLKNSNPEKFKEVNFPINRAKFFEKGFTFNSPKTDEDGQYISLPCECYAEKDTLNLHITIGSFLAGYGYNIKIYKNKFVSSFFIYTFVAKIYKANINDTHFCDSIITNNKYQHLILDKMPSFKIGQQLSGLLTLTSNKYYFRKENNNIDSSYVEGLLYFTCNTNKKKI